jgi:hypothetical protein
MKNKATPFGILALVFLAMPVANAAVIQTNFGTGDVTIPGGAFVSEGNLLSSNLSSATFLPGGSFYRQDSGYPVVLSRLYDGALGPLSADGLGGTGDYSVFPNNATLQFNLDGAFNLTTIRTYASWDDGRDGQRYVVKYATAAAPDTFTTLYSLSAFDNTSFPTREDFDENGDPIQVPNTDTSSTMVRLTSNSGALAENVVALQFVFNGYENGGTAFREFQVLGTSSVPEPSICMLLGIGALGVAFADRRRKSKSA